MKNGIILKIHRFGQVHWSSLLFEKDCIGIFYYATVLHSTSNSFEIVPVAL